VGDGKPTAEQRELYALAHEQVSRNMEIFKPGRSFIEIAENAWRLPERYAAYEQPAIAHGIGLCNEYPLVFHKHWIDESGHDGIVEPGMVFCVESYVGATDTLEGVKLEQQILITQDGCELLSTLEFEAELLSS
jgi:Xaa-Pro aminopeptidase